MPMTAVFLIFLMTSFWALMSASDQWNTRRDVHGVAAAAARAGAQGDPDTFREGISIDPTQAANRARSVLAAAGYGGTVDVDGFTVTVVVTGSVDYAFPSPGFPTTVTGSASADLVRGITGNEGG